MSKINAYTANLTEELQAEIITLISDDDSGTDKAWQALSEQMGDFATGGNKLKAARRYYARRRQEIKKMICEDEKIQKLMDDPITNSQIDIALIVAAKLLEEKFGGLDVAAIAVLTAKMGIMKLCGTDELPK